MENTAATVTPIRSEARSRAAKSAFVMLGVSLALLGGFTLFETASVVFSVALAACAAMALLMPIVEMSAATTDSFYVAHRHGASGSSGRTTVAGA